MSSKTALVAFHPPENIEVFYSQDDGEWVAHPRGQPGLSFLHKDRNLAVRGLLSVLVDAFTDVNEARVEAEAERAELEQEAARPDLTAGTLDVTAMIETDLLRRIAVRARRQERLEVTDDLPEIMRASHRPLLTAVCAEWLRRHDG